MIYAVVLVAIFAALGISMLWAAFDRPADRWLLVAAIVAGCLAGALVGLASAPFAIVPR